VELTRRAFVLRGCCGPVEMPGHFFLKKSEKDYPLYLK
jgi:hypothetical protein